VDPEARSRPVGLSGAFVVLGVSGGIAAYKAVELCRRLVDAGAHVAPVLTRAATRFVGAATFSALASEPARTELFGGDEAIPHTRLGRAADLVVVAPATARLLGSYAAGISSDLLTATLLATPAPVLVCPAMHAEMWRHPAVQENLATLQRRGVTVVGPEHGRLAGGDVGEGRLARLEAILEAAERLLAARRDLSGLRVLVTAGGTREPIDPVRYLANRSSGRQGHALAEVAAARGARVTLVTASELEPPSGVEVVRVETAAELAEAVAQAAPLADVVVMAAAVADFRPASPAPRKLKRRDGPPVLELEATPDVLGLLASRRRPRQVLVGFAAETGGGLEEAEAKLAAKGIDVIVWNDVSRPGVGFAHETNEVTILTAWGERTEVPLAPKRTIAGAVLDAALAARARAAARGAPSGAARRTDEAQGAGE